MLRSDAEMSESNEISPERVVEILNKVAQESSDVPIWYGLKAWKFKPIRPDTLRFTKKLLIAHCAGFEALTSKLVAYITSMDIGSIRSKLHILGDKHVLTWLRGKNEMEHRWRFNQDFISNIDLGEIRKLLEENINGKV